MGWKVYQLFLELLQKHREDDIFKGLCMSGSLSGMCEADPVRQVKKTNLSYCVLFHIFF